MAGGVVARPAPIADRFSRGAERLLRALGDARIRLALLLLTGAVNVAAALLLAGPDLLNGWPYAVLLGALALSAVAAVAAVAVRTPAAWREWRRPGPVRAIPGAVVRSVPVRPPEEVTAVLNAAGYRIRLETGRGRWAVHAVRRGWARFAAQASHLAVVLVVLAAAGLGTLFAGAALLCTSLAVAFWLPRRRLTVRPAGGALELVLRGERFDRPTDEAARLQRLLEGGA